MPTQEMRKIKMAADFRIYHVSDGASVAESISKKFTSDRYNLVVELYDLQRRSSSLSGSSNSSSQTSSITMPKADISVLLVTPAMFKFLNGAIDDDRSFTHILDPGKKPLVALSCFVTLEEVKSLVEQMFPDPSIQWRYLDVGDKSETFNQCTIGLLSLLEEMQEPMPVPKLKKCHLLPDTPVLAGDTIYILLESTLAASVDSSSLILVFENECQLQAKKIADCLYEFQIPECSYYKTNVEIFSLSGESFGSEEIVYKDKRDILASILADVVNPIEFMAQALQLNDTLPDVLDNKLSNWFKYKTSAKPYTELQKLLARWVKSLRCDDSNTSQELPTLLHLAAKYNLHNLAQTLLLQPWGTAALNVKNKDGHTPGQLAMKYYHIGLSDFLVAESEAEESSFEEEGESYINPEYCAPGAMNVVNSQLPNDLEMKFESNQNLKQSEYSNLVEENIALALNRVTLGNPAPCMKKLSTPTYMNLPAPQLQSLSSRKPLMGKSIVHGRYHSLDSSDANKGASNITSPPNLLQRALSERSSPMSPRSSGESSGSRPGTPPRQAQMLKVFNSSDNNVKENQSSVNEECSEPSLFKKNSKKGNKAKPCKTRRSSISVSQFYTPRPHPLKASQSLSRLNEISLIEEVPEPAAKPSPENNGRAAAVPSGSPKPCYPLSSVPPPLPTSSPPPFTSTSSMKAKFNSATSSNGAPPVPEKPPVLPVKLHKQISLKRYHFGNNGSFGNVSPDYSQPINVHFEDHIRERDFSISNDYITPRLDQLNESIYEEVDIKPNQEMTQEEEESQLLRHKTSRGRQSFRKIILVESESTTESLKQLQLDFKPQPESPTTTTPVAVTTTITSTTSSAASSSGVSTAVSSPTSPTTEEQPKSPSIFSSISSKFSWSKSKQYRSSKDHVTKM